MSTKLNFMKATAMTASLVLASAAIFGSAAWAAQPRDPVCDQRIVRTCIYNWESQGYAQYEDCVRNEQCLQCPPNYGYLCGPDPRFASVVRPDTGKLG